jgi:cell wall-associated NlpC family hydrolase
VKNQIEFFIDNAIAWAERQLGRDDYCFRCLAFVEDAYEVANAIEIFGGSSAKESADEYGVAGNMTDAPPRGAFVFYDMTGEIAGDRANYGHVGLHLGDGRIIHAWDEVRIDYLKAIEALEPAEGWTQPSYIGWAPVERILQGHK